MNYFEDPEVRKRIFVPVWDDPGQEYHGKAVLVWYDGERWMGLPEHEHEPRYWFPESNPWCSEDTLNYSVLPPRSRCAECDAPLAALDYLCSSCRNS